MKQFITISFAAASLAAMVTFTSCSKDADLTNANTRQSAMTTQGRTGTSVFSSTDRIDAIIQDLATDQYSLSFDKVNAGAGITRTAYGSDNYLVFADPQDLICPEPIRIKFPKGVPVWRRPIYRIPICPDLGFNPGKIGDIREYLTKIDPAQFRGLKEVALSNGGQLLASEQTFKTYSSMQTDRFDALTKDLDPSKFILLGSPDNLRGGVFTRNFYGYADLNNIVFKPYKINLKDLLKPTIKGCFDPIILQTIKDRLEKLNPAVYQGLDIASLPENKAIAVLN